MNPSGTRGKNSPHVNVSDGQLAPCNVESLLYGAQPILTGAWVAFRQQHRPAAVTDKFGAGANPQPVGGFTGEIVVHRLHQRGREAELLPMQVWPFVRIP